MSKRPRRSLDRVDYREDPDAVDLPPVKRVRLRTPLDKALGTRQFVWPAYRAMVTAIMDTAVDTDRCMAGDAVAALVATRRRQGYPAIKIAAAVVRQHLPLVQLLFRDKRSFGALSTASRRLVAAAALVRTGKPELTALLEARATAAEDRDIEARVAADRLEHVDATEHFDWAEEILLGTDDPVGLAESFSDDIPE